MEQFRTELHLHTHETSACGVLTAAEQVEAYKKAGYTTIVVTDHFSSSTFMNHDCPTIQDKVDFFLTGYQKMKELAGEDLNILLGAEFRFNENWNDYLVYGISEEFLRTCLTDDVLDMTIKEFSALCHEHGVLLIQAHPFRNTMTVTDPNLLDGVEVMNGSPFHESRNDLARQWADRYNLLKTSGSDCHKPQQIGRGGIMTEKKLLTIEDVKEAIQNHPTLIYPEDQKPFA